VDPSVRLARALLRVGGIDRAEYARRRGAFVARWAQAEGMIAGGAWLAAYAYPAESAEDAAEAIAARPEDLRAPNRIDMPLADLGIGVVAFLAGRLDEALPALDAAARTCTSFREPFTSVWAHDWLAQAREAKGDQPGACRAYADVLSRWGNAKPRSITAEHARARIRALGCK
jgi:serine/threonine-protein kinase